MQSYHASVMATSGAKNYDLMYYLKGAAAGGICCSITHGALTPVDVVKTRVQLDPVKVGVPAAAAVIVALSWRPCAKGCLLEIDPLGAAVFCKKMFQCRRHMKRCILSLGYFCQCSQKSDGSAAEVWSVNRISFQPNP